MGLGDERRFEALTTVFGAGIASMFVIVSTAIFGQRETLPMPQASVDYSFANERSIATSAGLRAIEDARVGAGTTRRTVRLNPGECLSAIVGVAGTTPPEPLRLIDSRTGETLQGERSTGSDFVRHMQWCSPRGGRFTVDVRSPQAPRMALFTGVPPSTRLPLPRVDPPVETRPRLYEELITAAMERDAGPVLFPAARHAASAPPLLLPSTPATRAALREAMLLDADADLSSVPLTEAPEAVARHDLADEAPTVPPEAPHRRRGRRDTEPAPSPISTARVMRAVSADEATPALRVLGLDARIITVVDPGALGAACVALRFAHADAGTPYVLRVDVPGWRAEALASQDGVARDVVCATDGPRVYARANLGPTAATVFSVEPLPTTDAGAATPSPWRGEAPQHSLVTRLEAECERHPRGCLALADLASVAGFRAPHPTAAESLRRACERQHAESCGRYGESLLTAAPRDVAAATAALRRGCELGDALTCAVLAAHERLGDAGVPQDLAAAFAHYNRACDLGESRACAARDTMRLLHLPG